MFAKGASMQNQHSASRILLLAWVGLLIVAVVGAFSFTLTSAEDTNLLKNPGFEGDYTAFNGDNNLMMAANWSPWSIPHQASDPGFANLQPQYQPAENPKRIHSGTHAQEYLTFFATHKGGVFQTVAVTPGAKLQFSVWVNVWSTSLDDPNASEQPGRLIVRVGIDPKGGSDGASPNIVWTTAPELYDQYQQVSVQATAAAASVTVFVESAPKDPVKNNNTYVDDASLVVTGAAAQPTTAIPAASTAVAVGATDTPVPIGPTQEGTIVVTVAAPTNTAPALVPTDTPIPLQPTLVQPGVGNSVTITVAPGDTLTTLATHYNTTAAAIAAANNLNADSLIFVGQSLVIPIPPTPTLVPPTAGPTGLPASPVAPVLSANLTGPTLNGVGTYIVQNGDTFAAIAQHYGLTVEALAQMNGIVNTNSVNIGTVLVVPGPGNNYPGGTIAPTILPTIAGSNGFTTPGTHILAKGQNLFRIS